MDTIINSTVEDTNQRVTVDFQYFITSAIQKEFSWKTLAFFLTDLTTSLDQSKEVIRLLVQELEIWVGKASSENKDLTVENRQYISQPEKFCKVTKEAKDFVKFEQSSENDEFLMKDEIVETQSSEERILYESEAVGLFAKQYECLLTQLGAQIKVKQNNVLT